MRHGSTVTYSVAPCTAELDGSWLVRPGNGLRGGSSFAMASNSACKVAFSKRKGHCQRLPLAAPKGHQSTCISTFIRLVTARCYDMPVFDEHTADGDLEARQSYLCLADVLQV